jgi:hypothetical protein
MFVKFHAYLGQQAIFFHEGHELFEKMKSQLNSMKEHVTNSEEQLRVRCGLPIVSFFFLLLSGALEL